MANIGKNETRFITFPVALLRDAFTDIKKVCDNAVNYAIYAKAQRIDGMQDALDFYGVSLSKNGTIKNVYQSGKVDRKSTRLNSSHVSQSRMPSSA